MHGRAGGARAGWLVSQNCADKGHHGQANGRLPLYRPDGHRACGENPPHHPGLSGIALLTASAVGQHVQGGEDPRIHL